MKEPELHTQEWRDFQPVLYPESTTEKFRSAIKRAEEQVKERARKNGDKPVKKVDGKALREGNTRSCWWRVGLWRVYYRLGICALTRAENVSRRKARFWLGIQNGCCAITC